MTNKIPVTLRHHHYRSPYKRALFSFLLVAFVMIMGTLGMHVLEHMPYLDAFYFMSMIATAQGSAYTPVTVSGKIFASMMSFLSVGFVVAALGFLFGPFLGKLGHIGASHYQEEMKKRAEKEKLPAIVIFFALTLLSPSLCWSSSSFEDVNLMTNDRILILAPHPDDEAIGTAGIIQRAVQSQLPLKIVYFTHGDNNELAFLVYKKHPMLSRAGLLNMGELRRKEATGAMGSLGVPTNDLIFLGYPDFGLTDIFIQHWGGTRPYKGMLTHVSAVPYKEAYSPNAIYDGESILNDLKRIIKDFQPTKVFVTLPADTNVDHRAAYLFLQVALWDLKDKIPTPEIFPYIVHVINWPIPRGFHPDLALNVPSKLSESVDWYSLELSPEEIEKKKSAIDFYKSQNAYNPRYLYSFARKNELFGNLPDIYLNKTNDGIDWLEHSSKQKVSSHLLDQNETKKGIIQSIAYAQKDHMLFVHLEMNHLISELGWINVFLIGYKGDAIFSSLPKLRIHINHDHFISIFDQSKHIKIKDMIFARKKNTLTIGLPLHSLGDPDYILSSAKTYLADYPLEATEWRTIILDKNESSTE